MKLLVSGMNALRTYISREFFYVMRDLIHVYGWKHVEPQALCERTGTLRTKLLNDLGEIPDVILLWEAWRVCAEFGQELTALSCRKCVFTDDLHYWNENMKAQRYAALGLSDTILSTYEYALDRFYPRLRGQKHRAWVPHSASPDFMLPYDDNPQNAILLSGAVSENYPLRQRMKLLSDERRYPIVVHEHPGYHCEYDYRRNQDIGEAYARKINKYRIAFTDCSRFGYVLAKYFEIAATGSLLLADEGVEEPLSRLGFIKDVHYVPVSADNLEDRIRYVLNPDHLGELDEVRRRAMRLVLKQHKTSDRAGQIDEACTR